jgi:L-seryl-tRNA(Ser) seleniumtransferase
MLTTPATARRALPSIDRLLNLASVAALVDRYGRPLVTDTLRDVLEARRKALSEAAVHAVAPGEDAIVTECAARLDALLRPSLRPVFNLTGTVLHTNLGRALLPESAVRAARLAMTQAVNLEFDLGGGSRGERDTHAERWLTRLTGAEAAVVVNNNAAAVYLVLNTLAPRREVIVSRGELIEIGGAFRIPDIMARAGCRLREVGTTNRTHPRDYEENAGERTAAIMKVHTSNYAIHGFTASVNEPELAAIAHERGLPFIVDLGSGMLVNLEDYGLPHETTPRETLADGADIVTFSGDKLLGGPQCGLIVGRRELIAKIRRNPMKRALRVDKVTLAALEAVLQLYANPGRLAQELPTLRLLTRPRNEIEAQARRVLPFVVASSGNQADAAIIDCASQIGSGSLPVDALPSAAIAIAPKSKRKGTAAEALASAFRVLPRPVIGRIKDGAFILDLRCLDDEEAFVAQLAQLDLAALKQ